MNIAAAHAHAGTMRCVAWPCQERGDAWCAWSADMPGYTAYGPLSRGAHGSISVHGVRVRNKKNDVAARRAVTGCAGRLALSAIYLPPITHTPAVAPPTAHPGAARSAATTRAGRRQERRSQRSQCRGEAQARVVLPQRVPQAVRSNSPELRPQVRVVGAKPRHGGCLPRRLQLRTCTRTYTSRRLHLCGAAPSSARLLAPFFLSRRTATRGRPTSRGRATGARNRVQP